MANKKLLKLSQLKRRYETFRVWRDKVNQQIEAKQTALTNLFIEVGCDHEHGYNYERSHGNGYGSTVKDTRRHCYQCGKTLYRYGSDGAWRVLNEDEETDYNRD